jgi:26S proteasome regulatory subunit T1
MMQEEQPLQVARCTKIIGAGSDDAKYVINVKQIAKFVVGLGEKVAPTDIEEGMRVGVDRTKYSIQIPLPPKIDPSVSLMQVEEKPDVTYDDVGGAKDALEKLREVVELPLLHPERFMTLGIDPPKGVLLYGPRKHVYDDELVIIYNRSTSINISWNWKNSRCASCCESHRRLFHSSNWIGTCPKVCR